jgi:amidase
MTRSPVPQADWRALVAAKRKQLDSQIPLEWRLSDDFLASVPADGHLIEADLVRQSGILADKELDITESYSAVDLLQRLSGGGFSSVDVTTAFCKRAAIAQQLVSYICIPCFHTMRHQVLITIDLMFNRALV